MSAHPEPPVTAWLVDLDGTLYHGSPLKVAMGAELALLGARSIPMLRAFRRGHERIRDELATDPTASFAPNALEEQRRRTAAECGVPAERVERVTSEWMIERPGKWIRLFRRRALLSRIAAFREEGGRTAVVSDYPASAKLGALGAKGLFDCVVANGEHPRLSRQKPAPDGLLLAAEELGVAAEACLVLGDRTDADGAAAHAAGMRFELVR